MITPFAKYDVMLGNPGDDAFNVLVLGGIDVVVPLERDLDDDPLQDDEITLKSVDGTWEQTVLSGSEDVEEDDEAGVLYYRFRLVPPGIYSVFVNVAGEPAEVVRGLIVRREGVFVGGRRLRDARPDGAFAADDDAPEESEHEERDPLPSDDFVPLDQEQD